MTERRKPARRAAKDQGVVRRPAVPAEPTPTVVTGAEPVDDDLATAGPVEAAATGTEDQLDDAPGSADAADDTAPTADDSTPRPSRRARRTFTGRAGAAGAAALPAGAGDAPTAAADTTATAETDAGPAARTRQADDLPYIDDRVSKIWVPLIAAVFGAVLLYGVLFGDGGALSPAPSATEPPPVASEPAASATIGASPVETQGASGSPTPSGSPSGSAGSPAASGRPTGSPGATSGSPGPSPRPSPASPSPTAS